MNKLDVAFVTAMDSLHWAFAGGSEESLTDLLNDFPKKYGKGLLSIDHYIALMNCGRAYLRILREG